VVVRGIYECMYLEYSDTERPLLSFGGKKNVHNLLDDLSKRDGITFFTLYFQYLNGTTSNEANIFRIYVSLAALQLLKISSDSDLPLQFYD
jgi:hypothetical protein